MLLLPTNHIFCNNKMLIHQLVTITHTVPVHETNICTDEILNCKWLIISRSSIEESGNIEMDPFQPSVCPCTFLHDGWMDLFSYLAADVRTIEFGSVPNLSNCGIFSIINMEGLL